MKYLLFWALAIVYTDSLLNGLILLLLATFFFEEDKPKEEPVKKE